LQSKKCGRKIEFEFLESVKIMNKDEFMKKLETVADAIYEFAHKSKKSKSKDRKEGILPEILKEEIAL